jgi:SAM-dependent methyltransferase
VRRLSAWGDWSVGFGVFLNRFLQPAGLRLVRLRPASPAVPAAPPGDRRVGPEPRKSYAAKQASGFFDRYLAGPQVLDIGYRGGADWEVVPIVPQAIGIDLDYPGYDGRSLPFASESQDSVYASHCLEHIGDYVQALQEWWRVLKIGGYLVLLVPHRDLYEKRARPPSRWNGDHKRFYTPARLMAELEEALPPNHWRLRSMIENDAGYDYRIGPDSHAGGCYEIEAVLEKIQPPSWTVT